MQSVANLVLPLVFLYGLPEIQATCFAVVIPFAIPSALNLLAIRELSRSYATAHSLAFVALGLEVVLYIGCIGWLGATALFFSLWINARWIIGLVLMVFTILMITIILTLRFHFTSWRAKA